MRKWGKKWSPYSQPILVSFTLHCFNLNRHLKLEKTAHHYTKSAVKNDTTSCDSSALQSHKFPPIIDKKRETKVASISWPKRISCKCKRCVRRENNLIIFTAHLIVSHYSNAEIKPIKHCINDFWREEKKRDGGGGKLGCRGSVIGRKSLYCQIENWTIFLTALSVKSLAF